MVNLRAMNQGAFEVEKLKRKKLFSLTISAAVEGFSCEALHWWKPGKCCIDAIN